MRNDINFLLDVEEELSPWEKERKKKLRWFLKMQAERDAEEAKWRRRNVCPYCKIVLTTRGKCTNDCGYVKKKL